jgi:hypothetical protein
VGTDQKSTVRRLGKKNLVSRHSGGLALVVLAVQPRRRVVLDHVTLVKVGLDRRRLQAPVCTVSVCLRRHSLTPNIVFSQRPVMRPPMRSRTPMPEPAPREPFVWVSMQLEPEPTRGVVICTAQPPPASSMHPVVTASCRALSRPNCPCLRRRHYRPISLCAGKVSWLLACLPPFPSFRESTSLIYPRLGMRLRHPRRFPVRTPPSRQRKRKSGSAGSRCTVSCSHIRLSSPFIR